MTAAAGAGLRVQRYCVGLTGGIGCGKTTVADRFAALGAAVVDTDLIAHELTAPHGAAMPAIIGRFGPQFANPDGSMNRALMRGHVFGPDDPEGSAARKRDLEAILHPLIRLETIRTADAMPGPYVMLVVPLLIESGAFAVDRVLAIDCPEQMQIARVQRRSGLAVEQIEAIMAKQISRAQRLAHADDVVTNDGSLAELEPQITRLHDLYVNLAGVSAAKS
ncbi:MAG TPA: dephospho-CoA kinase [Burkholderiaceae bacterium]